MNLLKNLNFEKLKNGLSKTRNKIFNEINKTLTGKISLDEKILDDVEEILITSDIGFHTTKKIIENTKKSLKSDNTRTKENFIEYVKNELKYILDNYSTNNNNEEELAKFKPYIILIVGVNGAGKTTTVGKLAYNYKKAGFKVIVGAADTFRAGANEQLDIWAKRAEVEVLQRSPGSDPSAVVYDVITKAVKEKFDIVIIDTAGRLHNKSDLMQELGKIKRVIKKILSYAPNETFLILDGTTGQNALLQAKQFIKITDLNGFIVTKLDGTAKGGIIFQLCSENKIPVKYIGVGERIDDLLTFDKDLFISAIFDS